MSGSKYPEQFRKDAVDMVRCSDRPLAQVARELGVNHETLRLWVKNADRADAAAADPTTAGLADEVRQLRKQVAELELEKEILRKAAAYFAKEMGR
ncbi:transposase [Kibdelosporangium lantanae]|uniref:Transposase n=1 Tax=Kibdelosporangium lantanae TaxID=1497396 RepID=A0ABW3M8Q6_9PSEU